MEKRFPPIKINDLMPSPSKKLHLDNQNQELEYDEEFDEENVELDKEEIIREIMQSGQEGAEVFDNETLFNMGQLLEKHIIKNQELRIKFPKNPEKFMESEVDLDEDIRNFGVLSAYPELLLDFSKSKCLKDLIYLTTHENIDIAIDAMIFFSDLIDLELDEENSDGLMSLYDELRKNKFLEEIVQNLQRLDENKQDHFNAVYKILKIIESFIEIMPDISQTLCDNTKILNWLLLKLNPKNILIDKDIDDNKIFASEILSMLLQNNRDNQFTFGKMGAIEGLLQIMAEFRKKDPETEEEEVMVENIYDCLTSCLLVKENIFIFKKLQGIELMTKIMKEVNFSSSLALKIISFTLPESASSSKIFIEAQGLKFLFPALLRKGIKAKEDEDQTNLDEYITVSILTLLKNTQNVYLDRVINKFKENNFEKLDRVFELFREYANKLELLQREYETDEDKKNELMENHEETNFEEAVYYKKLEKGLTIVENSSAIILFLYSVSDCLLIKKINQILKLYAHNLNDFQNVIREKLIYLNPKDPKGEKNFLETLLKKEENQENAKII